MADPTVERYLAMKDTLRAYQSELRQGTVFIPEERSAWLDAVFRTSNFLSDAVYMLNRAIMEASAEVKDEA